MFCSMRKYSLFEYLFSVHELAVNCFVLSQLVNADSEEQISDLPEFVQMQIETASTSVSV